MLADFLNPPMSEPGKKGTLTIYYQDHVQRAAVDQYVGRAIDVGDGDAKVELVHYFTNAKLDAAGQFQAVSEEVRNPLVELKVELPGDDQPYRQVAFAKSPLLNFDGVYERECPVKFVYEHPEIERATAIEFLQAGDGKLYGRTVSGGKCTAHGEVTAGRRLELPGDFSFTVTEYVPHARRDISYKPARGAAVQEPGRESAAAELQVAIAGMAETLWLQRNHPEFQLSTIHTADGSLRVQFTSASIPLGFTVELIDVQQEITRGGSAGSAAASLVRVIDAERHVDDQRLISMTQPLSHGGYRFYPSRLDDAGHGMQASILRVVYDPGRAWKKVGGFIVFLGIAAMVCMRSYARTTAAIAEGVAERQP
jgi:hypothetical protein